MSDASAASLLAPILFFANYYDRLTMVSSSRRRENYTLKSKPSLLLSKPWKLCLGSGRIIEHKLSKTSTDSPSSMILRPNQPFVGPLRTRRGNSIEVALFDSNALGAMPHEYDEIIHYTSRCSHGPIPVGLCRCCLDRRPSILLPDNEQHGRMHLYMIPFNVIHMNASLASLSENAHFNIPAHGQTHQSHYLEYQRYIMTTSWIKIIYQCSITVSYYYYYYYFLYSCLSLTILVSIESTFFMIFTSYIVQKDRVYRGMR